MFSEKTVKLLTDLPLAIINSATTTQDESLVQPKVLLKYAKDGNLKEIKKLFDSNSTYRTKQYLETFDELGQTPLILASRYGHYDLVVFLFESGAYINAYDYDNWTALLNACKEGFLEIVKYLVEHGAFIEHVDCGSFTPLIWACYKNHVEIVRFLIDSGANPNAKCKNSICCLSWASGRAYENVVYELLKSKFIKVDNIDKNGTTPLIWAARKGSLDIVKALVQYGANVDAVGMNNSTPLIISCKNGNIETALYLLTLDDINVNHIDKDGNSSLSVSAKAGYTDVVVALLEKGAYVNVPNKKGDSILITAVKNGHKDVVNALLKRHVEINAVGSQGKSALHFAIERSSIDMVKSLLAAKVDAEIADEDGQTPLLLASRKKNANIVNELLNYGCKLSVTDRDGDNALHIALRSRNRDITELLLSNPKNSKYLYKPNKRGETPYKVDANNQKSIITQIFGAKHLNMTEDSILGYDLYSSALAEILSEPSLNTPITVGLYAKWGSGKSFLLAQLKDEMKSFAKLTKMITLKINIFAVLTIVLTSLFLTYPVLLWKWYAGLTLYGLLVLSTFIIIAICKYNHNRERNEWSTRACERISKGLTKIKLLLQVLFLNPSTHRKESLEHRNLRFIFTDYGKISTIGGERALAQMVITLYKRIEDEYGFLVTRLCRVFQHKSHTKSVTSSRRFRYVCCIPTFVLIIIFIISIIGLSVLIRAKGFKINEFAIQDNIALCIFVLIILVLLITSSITCFKILVNFFKSPRMCIMRSLNKIQNGNKIEGFLLELKHEIDYMAETVLTLDAFTHSNTRLVVIIDGLDSCEQNKVLQILEIVHVLFTKEGDPYITILAVDPHVLIKGIEGNLMGDFCNKNGSLNGHEYLRTIIHLPIYLQINLSKAKALSKIAQETEVVFPRKRTNTISGSTQDVYSSKSIGDVISNAVDNKKNKKAKRERSVTKAKPMSAFDLTAQLMKNDYFLDVNPRNLRRLINIISITGRLLRAYHIDFNWNVLASWIYLVEQWPYRCSWIVMSYEESEGIEYTDETTLKEIYDAIRNKMQTTTSTTALMALDRNGRKFELLLENCKPPLTVLTLKKFLPCTCNLDPYLIKLIQESIEDRNLTIDTFNTQRNLLTVNSQTMRLGDTNDMNMHSFTSRSSTQNFDQQYLATPVISYLPPAAEASVTPDMTLNSNIFSDSDAIQIDMQHNLNKMTVDDVVDCLHSIDGLNHNFIEIYSQLIQEKNINGRVLSCCDIEELKTEFNMTFGDWQLFRNWLKQQRYMQILKLNKEKMQLSKQSNLTNKLLNSNLSNRLQTEKQKSGVPAVFSQLFTQPASSLENSIPKTTTRNTQESQEFYDTNDSRCPLIMNENNNNNNNNNKMIQGSRKGSARDFSDSKKVDFFINNNQNSPDSNQTTISSIETATINFLFDNVKSNNSNSDVEANNEEEEEEEENKNNRISENDIKMNSDEAETTALLEMETEHAATFTNHNSSSIIKRKLNKSVENVFSGESGVRYQELKSQDETMVQDEMINK